MHEVELGWEEDDLVGARLGKPGRARREERRRVLETTVGCGGRDRGRGLEGAAGLREREEVEVHLRGEAFGDVGWCYPAREGVEGVCEAFGFVSVLALRSCVAHACLVFGCSPVVRCLRER